MFDRAARNRLTSRLSFRGMTSLFARLVSVLFSGTRFEREGGGWGFCVVIVFFTVEVFACLPLVVIVCSFCIDYPVVVCFYHLLEVQFLSLVRSA